MQSTCCAALIALLDSWLFFVSSVQLILHSVIAITGLDGHAYGSWRGKGSLGRMWLRDFLCKDLPCCRTMIYGYNSKLSRHGVDTIMDYGRGLLEELKKVRSTQEVSRVRFRCDRTAQVRDCMADRRNALAATSAASLCRTQLWRHHTRSGMLHTQEAACTQLSICAVSR